MRVQITDKSNYFVLAYLAQEPSSSLSCHRGCQTNLLTSGAIQLQTPLSASASKADLIAAPIYRVETSRMILQSTQFSSTNVHSAQDA